jgi:hypothetical protein
VTGKDVVLDEAQPSKKLLSAMEVLMIAVLIIIAWWFFVALGDKDLNTLIEREVAKGAAIVECVNGQCMNIATNEVVGEGKDGKYLVYPKDSKTPEELRKVSEQVKQLDR